MSKSANALELLRNDHREVQQLFQRFERSGSESEQEKICREIVDALKLHTRIEEEVFYPYVREATDGLELVEEARVEHGVAKQLIKDLETHPGDGLHRYAVVKVLGEYIGHHIREEERAIFPTIQKSGVDLEALGQELLDHKAGCKSVQSRSAEKGVQGRSAEKGVQGRSAEKGVQGRSAEKGVQSRSAEKGVQSRSAEKQSPSSRAASSAGEDEQFVEEHGDQLSPSTKRAKWIHSPDETEDYPGQTLATRNIDVIKAWAAARNAIPATTPEGDPERPRVLLFDFPGYKNGLQHVSWEAWSRVFRERELVFLFQQHTKDGKQSNFFRLDSPHREDA